jgi:hypothetical protein
MTNERKESVKNSIEFFSKEENKNITYTPLFSDDEIQGFVIDVDTLNEKQIKWFNDKAEESDEFAKNIEVSEPIILTTENKQKNGTTN